MNVHSAFLHSIEILYLSEHNEAIFLYTWQRLEITILPQFFHYLIRWDTENVLEFEREKTEWLRHHDEYGRIRKQIAWVSKIYSFLPDWNRPFSSCHDESEDLFADCDCEGVLSLLVHCSKIYSWCNAMTSYLDGGDECEGEIRA